MHETRRGLRLPSVTLPFADIPGPFRGGIAHPEGHEDHATADQVRGMHALWWDGFFANIPETIFVTYLGLYVVAFGGSNAQVGVVASLTSLFIALAFFPGARVAEVFGNRKLIVMTFGGTISRLAVLSLALVPFFADGDAAIWWVIALASVRGFAGSFGLPAWTSLTADIVPLGLRGRYLASRNLGMSIAGLATAPLAGFLLDRFTGLEGWQLIWFFAFAAGAASTWWYSRIPDPAPHRNAIIADGAAPSRGIVADVLSDKNFSVFLLSALVWNLGLHAAGPYFNVYMADELDASGLWIGGVNAVLSITGIVGFVYFGKTMDQRGTRWVMIVTGLLIPTLPAAWLIITHPWQVLVINLYGGVLWAGYQLAALNMTMLIPPAEKRARYAAAFHAVTFAGAFVGPLLGSAIIAAVGYYGIFIFSAVGRMLGTLIMVRFVHVDERRRT